MHRFRRTDLERVAEKRQRVGHVTEPRRDVIVGGVDATDRRPDRNVFRYGHVVDATVKTRPVVVAVGDREMERRRGRTDRISGVGDSQPEPEVVAIFLVVERPVCGHDAGDGIDRQ